MKGVFPKVMSKVQSKQSEPRGMSYGANKGERRAGGAEGTRLHERESARAECPLYLPVDARPSERT